MLDQDLQSGTGAFGTLASQKAMHVTYQLELDLALAELLVLPLEHLLHVHRQRRLEVEPDDLLRALLFTYTTKKRSPITSGQKILPFRLGVGTRQCYQPARRT
jgi:hypothetical protein